MDPLLKISNLRIEYETESGMVHAVNDLSMEIRPGEIVGVIGESGSGKTMTALSIMGLLPKGRRKVQGSITFRGQELLTMNNREIRTIRNRQIGMIFQDPMSALNPVMPIGKQVMECLHEHEKNLTASEKRNRVLELMRAVRIQGGEDCFHMYPHQLSGGMRQRVMIAIAIACRPSLLIADEPTTSLDVTIQAQILKLLVSLNQKENMSILLVSHDLAVSANTCQYVAVLYGGKIMEYGTTEDIFRSLSHPYTQALLRSVPDIHQKGGMIPIEGTPIDGLQIQPDSCPFYHRCPKAMYICKQKTPPETVLKEQHFLKCWLPIHQQIQKGEAGKWNLL